MATRRPTGPTRRRGIRHTLRLPHAGPHPMTTAWLRRHLGVVLAVKCVLLAALWWCFFREARPAITAEAAASHLLSTQQERPE